MKTSFEKFKWLYYFFCGYCLVSIISSTTITTTATTTEQNYSSNEDTSEYIDSYFQQNILYQSFLNYTKTNSLTIFLKDLVEQHINQQSHAVCIKCIFITSSVLKYTFDYGVDNLELILHQLCLILLNDFSDQRCSNEAHSHFPAIKYMVTHKNISNSKILDFTANVCNLLFNHECKGTVSGNLEKLVSGFHIDIDLSSSNLTSHLPTYNPDNNLTIIQFTDFHYDPEYAVGSISNCNERICCRNSSTKLTNTTKKTEYAGKWGDYNICDSPGYLIENICQQVASQHKKIDFIYYTGDFVDHFDWLATRESVKQSIKFVVDIFKREFPNITIIPVMGNHDTHPADFITPTNIDDPEIDIKWLYNFLADEWKDWLPESSLQSLRNFGYYSMKVRPGLRVISLNTNVCYMKNLWIAFETKTLVDQLNWLIQELESAEQLNERVHIISHIPPTKSCLPQWVREYNKIIYRFAHIITGKFHGHTHLDEFYLNFWTSSLTDVAWNGGSGTSFIGLNSNYRLYYLDNVNFEVLDHDTWIFNLTEANLNQEMKPNWIKEYSFKECYGMGATSLGLSADFSWFQNPSETIQKKMDLNRIKHSDGFKN